MGDNSKEKRSRASHQVSLVICEGFGLLYQAYQYAMDVACDPWEFAVEIEELRAGGMTNGDFRWLLCKGYLQHAREVRTDDEDRRQFAATGKLSFRKRSCFVLTEQGLTLARSLFEDSLHAFPAGIIDGAFHSHSQRRSQPNWDGERHQFFVFERLVKEFKVPSPNQETILTAFQEEGWPIRIDDPLAPTSQSDGKRRLHDTIKSLNRNQKLNLIRFMGDGTGEGVCWELTPDDEESLSANAVQGNGS